MSAARTSLARVIVVDDDRLMREMLEDAISDLARVETCASGEHALDSLAREPAALVISDLTMPGMSGTELLERIVREHPGTDFVLITANASVETAVEALRLGAADYLIKPCTPDELVHVVERLLGRRRLVAENTRLRDALRTLEACRRLMSCLDPGEVYAVALDVLQSAIPSSRGLALFRRTSVPTSDGIAFRGFGEGEAERLRDVLVDEKPVELGGDETARIVTGGTVLEALRRAGCPCGEVLAVPVAGQENEAGVLWLLRGERSFEEADLDQARLVAGHAQLALENAERYSRAKERAFIDDVTEVYNARFLLQQSERELQRASRYRKPLSVLFLDLDRFKLVNDNHGHLVGSNVLRRLSGVLQDCIRQVDTLARYGGDEFTILLVDSDHEQSMSIAERIRRTVADTIFEGARGEPIRLTISIGVASFPAHARNRDHLLDAADKAMYRAKSRGRDCCCSASELAEPS